MNSIQIDVFLMLTDLKNYTKTAEQMFMSQKSVRKYIADLEEELGVKLFRWVDRTLTLTREGTIFYNCFSDSIEAFHEALEEARNLSKNAKQISVILEDGLDHESLLEPFWRFQSNAANVNLQFYYQDAQNILYRLKYDNWDLAVLLSSQYIINQAKSDGIALRKLCSCQMKLYYSIFHPLNSSERPLELSDFKGETFLLTPSQKKYFSMRFPPENITGQEFYETKVLGFSPKYAYMDSIEGIIVNTESNQGVSVLPEYARINISPLAHGIPLHKSVDINLAWKYGNPSKDLNRLINFCCAYDAKK